MTIDDSTMDSNRVKTDARAVSRAFLLLKLDEVMAVNAAVQEELTRDLMQRQAGPDDARSGAPRR